MDDVFRKDLIIDEPSLPEDKVENEAYDREYHTTQGHEVIDHNQPCLVGTSNMPRSTIRWNPICEIK